MSVSRLACPTAVLMIKRSKSVEKLQHSIDCAFSNHAVDICRCYRIATTAIVRSSCCLRKDIEQMGAKQNSAACLYSLES